MLFNDYVFIGAFLPITLLGFHLVGGRGRQRPAAFWLVLASLVFYGWWNPLYVPLLLGSILFNYLLGQRLATTEPGSSAKALLVAGISANLLLLGYFKYTGFLVETWNGVAGTAWAAPKLILPLGISFFTFIQIGYLMDAARRETEDGGFLDYCLFITFFPHLIAGPLLSHREMLPQFSKSRLQLEPDNLMIGLTIFLAGLFQKVLLADSISVFVEPVFHAAATGGSMSTAQAWAGALAYTLQLYFDFAGYSDMAIGLARMFGILFPANFNSPYRAVNISDFWRRWHITLSEWIRTRVFMKMTGRRATRARLYGATLVSMTLCGLWHGASWNFIFWGALHGLYLVIYYNWRALPLARRVAPLFDGWWGPLLARGLTFLCVVVGWVFFRARDWNAALALLGAMAGRGAGTGAALNLDSKAAFLWIAALLSLAWFAPNVQQWMAPVRPTLDPVDEPARRPWKPAVLTGLALGALLFLVVKGYFTLAPTQFLYFNF